MNNINKYPVGWRGPKPKPETLRRAAGARRACEKIEQMLGAKRLFFKGKLPIKPAR